MARYNIAKIRALRALDAAEGKKLRTSELKKASGVKNRGFHSFVDFLIGQRLVHRECDEGTYELTLAGMSAIAKAEGC